ncbi:MAG: spore germination protein GerW family protein [Saprospiraceae bacterium]|nr:spore germination protein GerW family protein [Saprospiraceae bacterium]
MEMQFEKLLERVTNFIQNEAKTETVIGDQFELGMYTCIPVIRVGMGFGTGGGEGDDTKKGHGEGAGAGAGLGIQPIGFLVSKGNDISFVSTTTNKGLAAAFEKVPDLLEKYLDTRKEAPELVT